MVKIFLLPFSHLDITFMGSHDECLSRANKVLALAFNLLEQYQESTFLIEYALFVESYLETFPAQRDRIHALVESGRLEIGPLWSGIYQNSEEEENLVRNILFAQDYLGHEFRRSPASVQLTDLPGFTPQFPQVLGRSGLRFCIITRSGPETVPLFRWRALDGSEVLTCYSRGYHEVAQLGLHRPSPDQDLAAIRDALEARVEKGPVLMHWGRDMYLPSRALSEGVGRWNERQSPKIEYVTPDSLRVALEDSPGVQSLRGDMPSVWGYYLAAHADITTLEPQANAALSLAERMVTLEWLLQRRPSAPQIDGLWKKLLLARDHNFAGKGAAEGQRRKKRLNLEVISASEASVEGVIRKIGEQVEVPSNSVPIVVFNPNFWNQSGPVEAHVTLYPAESGMEGDLDIFGDRGAFGAQRHPMLKDTEGQVIPYQITDDQSGTLGELTLVFFASDVPSFGYRTYYLTPTLTEPTLSANRVSRPRWFSSSVDRIRVDAGSIAVMIDERTGTLSLVDPASDEPIAGDIKPFGVVEEHLDYLREMPPHGLSQDAPELEGRREIEISVVRVVENGPVRTKVEIEGLLFANRVREEICVYPNDRVDIELALEWQRAHWNRVEWQIELPGDTTSLHYGVPFGGISWDDVLPGAGPSPMRPDETPRSSWSRMRIAQKWIKAHGPGWSLVIATPHRLWRRRENRLEAVLVRGGRMAGKHETTCELRYSFSLFPAKSSASKVAVSAHQLGFDKFYPLIPYVVNDTVSAKSLPMRRSFVSVEGLQVVVTAFKPTDDGEALLMRYFEPEGNQGSTTMRFAKELKVDQNGCDSDMTGRGRGTRQSLVDVRPWSIGARIFPRENARL